MPQFETMSYAYLKNKAAKLKLNKRREEVVALSHGQIDRSIADMRTDGIEKHHSFTFEQLEKMRQAIKEHKVTGKVRDLRDMMTLFQQYIDAAETSYGIKGKDVDARAVSLNAMVSLHMIPPQKAEIALVANEVATQDAGGATETIEDAIFEAEGSDIDHGSEAEEHDSAGG